MTATTLILKGSGLVPEKTVSACPTIPGRTSASGRIAGGGPRRFRVWGDPLAVNAPFWRKTSSSKLICVRPPPTGRGATELSP